MDSIGSITADENQDSSTGQRVDLVLGSGAFVRVMPWQLHLEERRIDYDDLEDADRIRRARAEVSYQFNRSWALAAALGYEEYELAVSEDRDGEIWSIGFIYTPTSRTQTRGRLGERSFGNDYYLDFSHRSKRVVWNANYARDVVSARDEVLGDSLFARQDEFGNLIRDPVLSSPVTTTRSGASLTEEYFLSDKFTTAFSLATEQDQTQPLRRLYRAGLRTEPESCNSG